MCVFYVRTYILYAHGIHVWYIYLHELLMFMVNASKYTIRPMDP